MRSIDYSDYPGNCYLEYNISDVYFCWYDMQEFVRERLEYEPIVCHDDRTDTRLIAFKTDEDRSFFLLNWSSIPYVGS